MVRKIWCVVVVSLATFALIYSFYLASLSPDNQKVLIKVPTEVVRGEKIPVGIMAYRAEDGTPIEGANVEIKVPGVKTPVKKGQTNGEGHFEAQLNLEEMESKEVEFHIRVTSGEGEDQISRIVSLKDDYRLTISTNQPLYQPGQTIRFRLLALSPAMGKPRSGIETTTELLSPRGHILYRKKLTTSAWGVGASSFALSDRARAGMYTLRAKSGHRKYSRKIEVKEYSKPRFRLDFKRDQNYFYRGEKISGRISARYFFGRPLKKARALVLLKDLQKNQTLQRKRLTLGPKGEGQFSLPLPKDEYKVALKIEVEDSVGQREVIEKTLPLYSRQLKIDILPSSQIFHPGQEVLFYLRTRYSSGEPAPATVRLLDRTLSTNDRGLAQVKVPLTQRRWEEGLGVSATDRENRKAHKIYSFREHYDKSSYHYELHRRNPFYPPQIDFSRSLFQGGDRADFTVLSSVDSLSYDYYCNLYSQSQLVKSTKARKEGKNKYSIPLPTGAKGLVRVEVCALDQDRRVSLFNNYYLYLRPGGQLQLESKLSKKQYRPGEKVSLGVELTGPEGKRREGVVGISAIDQRVLAAAGNKKIFETDGPLPNLSTSSGHSLSVKFALARLMAKSPNFYTTPLKDLYPAKKEDIRKAKKKFGIQWNLNMGYLFFLLGLVVVTWTLARVEHVTFLTFWLLVMGIIAIPVLFFAPVNTTGQAIGVLITSTLTGVLVFSLSGDENFHPTFSQKGLWAGLFLVFVGLAFAVSPLSSQEFEEIPLIYSIFFFLVGLLKIMVHHFYTLVKFQIYRREKKKFRLAFENFLLIVIVLSLVGAILLPNLLASRKAAYRNLVQNREGQSPSPSRTSQVSATESQPPLLREYFPDSLYWNPAFVVADGQGQVEFSAAHSITSYQISLHALTKEGLEAVSVDSLTVSQPFFLHFEAPSQLQVGDEIHLPVILYNYREEEQTVEVRIEASGGMEIGKTKGTLVLPPRWARILEVPLRAEKFGTYSLTVRASGPQVSDGVKKTIEILPPGIEKEKNWSGKLKKSAQEVVALPPQRVKGTGRIFVEIMPGPTAYLIKGVAGLIRLPGG